jgi:hypothetical protein
VGNDGARKRLRATGRSSAAASPYRHQRRGGGAVPVAAHPTASARHQPLPRVLPAVDLAALEDPFDAKVLPAFESAPLLGLPLLFAMLFTSFLRL